MRRVGGLGEEGRRRYVHHVLPPAGVPHPAPPPRHLRVQGAGPYLATLAQH